MNVTNKPDSLSLTGNINPIVVQTTKELAFVLKKGDEQILSQSFNPGTSGSVTIKIGDILDNQLRFTLKDITTPYLQDTISGDFTAVLTDADGTTTLTWTAIRCGVDNLKDTASDFLKYNFLTWQPTVKKVTYYSPEYLTYYAIEKVNIKIKAVYQDETSNTKTLISLTSGQCTTIPLSYGIVYGLFGTLPSFYDVWAEDETGNKISYTQRYVADNARSEHEAWILFTNSLGGMDCFRAYGAQEFTGEHTHNVVEIDEENEEYRVDTVAKHKKYTGSLTISERKWLQDFFPSLTKYIASGTDIRKIVVVESEDIYNDVDQATGFSFTYRYTNLDKYLNIPRNVSLPDNISVSVPDLGNFTLPPRLLEFPTLSESEGVMFPAQGMYSEKWGKISLQNILDYLDTEISSGTGLSWQKIKDSFLSKISEDTAKEIIHLLKGSTYGEFIEGIATGKGGRIDEGGNGELQSLTVRSFFRAMETIINRLQIQEGDFVFTESGTIESVQEKSDGSFILTMRKRFANDKTAIQEGDVLYGSINNLDTDGTYFTSWLRAYSVDVYSNTITAIYYSDIEVPAGKNFKPVAGMTINRRGNATNEDRQSCWYISSYEGTIMFLSGVTKPILDESNYCAFFGLPKHLELFSGLPINYKQPYLFCRAAIIQDILRIDYKGNPVYQIVDLGKWDSLTQYIKGLDSENNRYIQHQTWYGDCCWRCLADKATIGKAPRWNNTEWTCIVGDKNFTLEISSSAGRFFRFGQEYTTLTYQLKHGSIDITADASQIVWTRISTITAEDDAWNTLHATASKSVDITPNDMPSNWKEIRTVSFKVTISIKDGQTTQTLEQEINIQ
jgi:hypothetical protein